MIKTKRNYKDRLFCKLFGDADYIENTLSLYNALCGTSYNDINQVIMYTLEDVVYIGMKNDVAILLDSYLSVWEQQSSFNPNMPIRGLMYYGRMYDRYIQENKLNLYGEKLIKLPTPRYTVFYNGKKEQAPFQKLRLSDAFIKAINPGDFEWTADMINLNKGCNDSLLEKCRPLAEYMTFVNAVNDLLKTMPIEKAIDAAVEICIKNGILKKFLLKNKAEVKNMCITEFNEEVFINGIREEGLEQGQNLIVDTIHRLKNGESAEDIINSGIDKTTVELALTCI